MKERLALPRIIQGGMGVGVSGWRLARAVSMSGQLGVVSGSMIDTVMVRRLQDGDAGGHVRRALSCFPVSRVGEEVVTRYYREGGRRPGEGYRLLPVWRAGSGWSRQALNMAAAFVEVHLAKEGHGGLVGLNLLTKIQLPNLSALYGAMLAGVDFVLMGAGIPREIPGALDRLSAHEPASLRFQVEGARPGEAGWLTLDPADYLSGPAPALRRPGFLAVVANATLATVLARKANGMVDGFVVERPVAGGHNAPPRGRGRLGVPGEPVYDVRDEVRPEELVALGVPFWVAGGMGSPAGLRYAEEAGAAGVQVGTLFAYCDESDLADALKRSILDAANRREVVVRTDGRASPTGYPFKIVEWPGDPASASYRRRRCDLGYLRVPYLRPDGGVGYRCAAEPVGVYVGKGGRPEETDGKRCLCNGLTAAIGLGQLRGGQGREPPVVTSGTQLESMADFLGGRTRYAAADVVAHILAPGRGLQVTPR